MFRRRPGLEVLIGHMGGPFWSRKEERAWSVPKGLIEGVEQPLEAALREFAEETGLPVPPGPVADLGVERQRSRKVVHLFAVEAEVDLGGFTPGTFTMSRGGRAFEVPEIDRLEYIPLPRARMLLVAGQVPFLDRLPR